MIVIKKERKGKDSVKLNVADNSPSGAIESSVKQSDDLDAEDENSASTQTDDPNDEGGEGDEEDLTDEVESELPESIAEAAKDFFAQHSEEAVFHATEDGNFFFERDEHLAKHHAQVSKIRMFTLKRNDHGETFGKL